MARAGVKAVSVYITDQQRDVLERAAMRENRSVSNFLLTLGLDKAEAMGIPKYSSSRRALAAKPARAGAGKD